MNRETKRLLQRQGQVEADGSPALRRPVPPKVRQESAAGKPGVPARIGIFLGEVRSELRKVAWPTRSEVTNYSVVVVFALLIVGVMVFALDYGCTQAVIFLFKK